MAGKKGRKRPRAKNKNPKENRNETSTSVEGKKAKLNDGLKKRDEPSADKREPSLETDNKCNNSDNGKDDLQDDESKYVPPFSRKVKRALKRSGSPVSPAEKPKRSWRGVKQNSKQVLPEESSGVPNDEKQCNKDSPKIEKEENKGKEEEEDEEDEIDVVGIEPQTYSQEDENFVVHSTKQTTDKDVNMAKVKVILSPALLINQEEAMSIVRHLLDNVIDAVCKMEHCYTDRTMTDQFGHDTYNGSASPTIQAVDSHISSSETTPEIEKEDDVPNPEMEHSALISNENSVVSLSDNITSNREELHPISTRPIPSMDTELKSSQLQFADCEPGKENCYLSKTARDTEMDSETDVDMLTLEDVASTDICHGDAVNSLCQLNTHQSLDQMVPAYCEPTTVLSQNKPDQNGIEKCLTNIVSLKTPNHLEEYRIENQTKKLEENINNSSAPKTGSTREMEEPQQEEALPQPFSAGKACRIYRDQETSTCKGVDQTVATSVESYIQGSPTCKQMEQIFQGEDQSVLPSVKQVPGCSSVGSQSDIFELDCVMDCSDSQLVHLDSSPDQPPHDKLYTRQVNNSKLSGDSKSKADNMYSVEVPSDNGMIKGLISELSSLNKFIMVAWKDLENQKKQRQARLKAGKGKKLK